MGVTVPAATWLLGQTPAKSDHGHHDEEPHVVTDEEGNEEEAPQEEQEKAENEDQQAKESKEDSDDGTAEGKDKEPKSDDSGSEDEGKETPPTSDDEQEDDSSSSDAPGQINKDPRKGPGEQQKGERQRTETKGEKDVRFSHTLLYVVILNGLACKFSNCGAMSKGVCLQEDTNVVYNRPTVNIPEQRIPGFRNQGRATRRRECGTRRRSMERLIRRRDRISMSSVWMGWHEMEMAERPELALPINCRPKN